MVSKSLLPEPQDDGLLHYEVGGWAETKHSLVGLYDRLFSTGMKNKWDCRVYIELYAGPGLLRIRGTNRFIWGSPIHALGIPDAFDKYIFCDSNAGALEALQKRVSGRFPGANASFIAGSCDEKIEEICKEIPGFSTRTEHAKHTWTQATRKSPSFWVIQNGADNGSNRQQKISGVSSRKSMLSKWRRSTIFRSNSRG
jgi:hypothetical protein